MLATAEIDWIEARGDYARIHRGGRSDLVRESLSSLEGRLGPARFVRIHRSAIVNLARVREFKSGGGGDGGRPDGRPAVPPQPARA